LAGITRAAYPEVEVSNLHTPSELREMTERRRLADKRAAAAAERRSGVSEGDLIEEGANEWLRKRDARRQTTSVADDIKVSTDDLDPDLVGEHAVGDAYRRRLDNAISAGMEGPGYAQFLAGLAPEFRAELLARDDVAPSIRRRFADQRRVANEVGKPKRYTPPPKPEPKPELTGTALIEEGAREFLAQLDKPKRTRRR
jgi:hypothetical protein